MPTIHLKDIGKKQGGATSAEVAKQVIAAISSSATKAVGTLNLDKVLKGVSSKALKGVQDKAKGTMDKVIGKDGVGAAGDKVKGLFGK